MEETTVDKLRAEATTIDDELQADVRMVAPTAIHNNQHACCMLGVPTFFHPIIISIPLTLNIGGINGMIGFQLFVFELCQRHVKSWYIFPLEENQKNYNAPPF